MRKLSIMLAVILMAWSASAMEIYFNESGTVWTELNVSFSSISDFSFSISGAIYNNSYPSNITIDIGNDSIIDWEFNVYNSTLPIPLTSVTNAWAGYLAGQRIDFLNFTKGDYFFSLESFGYIENSIFQRSGVTLTGGFLGISTSSSSSISSQIVSIVTNNRTIHAFLPNMSLRSASTGLYVAEGGSTYFCQSNHSLSDEPICDLSFYESANDTNLARAVNSSYFSYSEIVHNNLAVQSINNILNGCSLPCNISIKITSASGGMLNISDFNFTSVARTTPANITLADGLSDYIITIQPYANLTNIIYFYGEKPSVYVIPIQHSGETRNLTLNQTNRLNLIGRNLAEAWDNLTNFSHPMSFNFYTNMTPYQIRNMSSYQDVIFSSINFSSPSIVVFIDVWDYFQNARPVNYLSNGRDDGIIGSIYINGFFNLSTLSLADYDSEIMINIILHELMHTFAGYPVAVIDGTSFFYTYHPAGFRTSRDFPESYNVSASPTGNEAYFDIYSVLNPVRIYSSMSSLGNRSVELSFLDKMLLGTMSPSYSYNYTLYNLSISLQDGRYVANNVTPALFFNTTYLYAYRTDNLWWDVRNSLPKTYLEINLTSFNVSKENQLGRALWVFAEDVANPWHFAVFNNNASSTSQFITDKTPPSIYLSNSVANVYNTAYVTLSINTSEPVVSCSYYDNSIVGSGSAMTSITNQSFYSIPAFSNGRHNITFRCVDFNGNMNSTMLASFVMDVSRPTLGLPFADTNEGVDFYNSTYFTINVSLDVGVFKNITFFFCNLTSCNITTSTSGSNSSAPYGPLTPGRYSYKAVACGYSDFCNSTSVQILIIYPGASLLKLNLSEWDMNRTTDIFLFNESQLHSIQRPVFANGFGKISFLQNLNFSHSGQWDLRGHLKVGRHRIFVNSSEFSALNKSAMITFEGVSLTNPLIYLDGSPCSSSICTNSNFNASSGVFLSNVSHFSEYTLVEQCSSGEQDGDETGTDCGGSCSACSSGSSGSSGGGGGGGGGGGASASSANVSTQNTSAGSSSDSGSSSQGSTPSGKNTNETSADTPSKIPEKLSSLWKPVLSFLKSLFSHWKTILYVILIVFFLFALAHVARKFIVWHGLHKTHAKYIKIIPSKAGISGKVSDKPLTSGVKSASSMVQPSLHKPSVGNELNRIEKKYFNDGKW